MRRIIPIVVTALFAAGLIISSPAQAQQQTKQGPMAQSETWDDDDSTYEITGPLSVPPNITLTIQAGVEVEVEENASLTVAGTLDIQGEEGNPVVFVGDGSQSDKDHWDGITFTNTQTDSRIEGLHLSNANTGIQTAASSSWDIVDSRFTRNTTGVALSDSPDPSGAFEHNYVDGNTTGVQANNEVAIFQLNTITDNKTGLDIRTAEGAWRENNIFGNDTHNATSCEVPGVTPPDSQGIDATDNWWGIADDGEIEDTICDNNDEETSRVIDFQPFESAAIAGAATIAPPSPSPSASSSPSTSPSSSPSPPPPPAEHARTVTLKLAKHLRARGVVTVTDGFAGCVPTSVTVNYRRRGTDPWKSIAQPLVDTTTGAYRAKVKDRPGVYRTVVAQTSSETDVCLPARSPKTRHSHRR